VLVLVTVDAEILPVGAVRRIIPGIPILVVHRQKLPVAMSEFPPALGANQPVDFQGAFPVVADWGFQLALSSQNPAAVRRLHGGESLLWAHCPERTSPSPELFSGEAKQFRLTQDRAALV
jgi:hypothetical protein